MVTAPPLIAVVPPPLVVKLVSAAPPAPTVPVKVVGPLVVMVTLEVAPVPSSATVPPKAMAALLFDVSVASPANTTLSV